MILKKKDLNDMRHVSLLLMATVVLILSGCATLGNAPSLAVKQPDTPEVSGILTHLGQINAGLQTFKGTGNVKLWKKNGVQVLHAVWSGFRPDKLRIVLEGISGFPVASMAADGDWFYLLSYSDNNFYKSEIKNPDLEKLVSIPVPVSDLIFLISGGIPIRNYFSSTLSHAGSGYMLSLHGDRNIDVERIYLDADKKQVQRIDIFSEKGQLSYRVDRVEQADINGFEFPKQLVFSGDTGPRFQLDIRNFWPNAAVFPDMFVITPQG